MPSEMQLKCSLLMAATLLLTSCVLIESANEQTPNRPWLRSRLITARQQPPAAQPTASGATNVVEPAAASQPTNSNQANQSSGNRTVRTTDVFENGTGYNIFVTNTCERDSMKINVKMSKPFYGIIHTKLSNRTFDQRPKPICSVEGNGDTDYNLEISHVLNEQDPAYCGVIRARRDSPLDKDELAVVVAVRVHRDIQRSDDKFFRLNCANRCRNNDCSSPSAKLSDIEAEETPNSIGRERENSNQNNQDECTVWKFPWLITLLWCLAILCLAMIISHCIMCSSLVCRCVRTEVEEREPSVYEGATDYEDDQYNKRHPYRIDYDNRDIYKTSNNYAPYNLEEAQTKSRQKTHKKGIS